MKPVQLKLKGLNSFTEEQHIDFDKLTAKGLFGIFGPTGSGKSTIIDAVTMALFGEMSRYDGERKNKHFINAISTTMWVYFEFTMTEDGKEVTYVAERSYKRHHNTQKAVLARLYKKSGTDIDIISDKPAGMTGCVEALIGLNYKDFSRSVILPQGKFSQFLLLANMDRRNMLERIFGLEKYGNAIAGVVKSEYGAAIRALEIIQKQLEIYGDLTKETVASEEKRLSETWAKLQARQAVQQQAEQHFEDLKSRAKLYSDYLKSEQELNGLLLQKEDMDAAAAKEKRALNAAYILPSHREIETTKALLDKNNLALQELLPLHEKRAATAAACKLAAENATHMRVSRIDGLKAKEYDFKRAAELSIKLQGLADERKALREQYRELKQGLQKKEEDRNRSQQEKVALMEKLQSVLTEKSRCYTDPLYRTRIEKGAHAEKKIQELQTAAHGIQQKIKKSAQNTALWSENLIALIRQQTAAAESLAEKNRRSDIHKQQSPPDHTAIIAMKEKALQQKAHYDKKAEKQQQYNALLVEIKKEQKDLAALHQKLETLAQKEQYASKGLAQANMDIAQFEKSNMAAIIAKGLAEGAPCPVCGATNHPAPAQEISEAVLQGLRNKAADLTAAVEHYKKEGNQTAFAIKTSGDALEKLMGSLREFDSEISAFHAEKAFEAVKELSEESDRLLNLRSKWEEEGKTIASDIMELQSLCRQLTLQIQSLKESIQRENRLLAELEKELAVQENGLKESKRILAESSDNLEITSFNREYEKLQEQYLRYTTLEQEENRIRTSLDKALHKTEELDKAIGDAAAILESVRTQGQEKSKQVDAAATEINALAGDANPNEALEEIKKEITALNENETTAVKTYETATADLNKSALDLKGLQDQNQTYREILAEQESKIKALLNTYGFVDYDDFTTAVMEQQQLDLLSAELACYQDKLKNETQTLLNLKNSLEGKDTSHIFEKKRLAEEELAAGKEEIMDLSNQAAVLQREIEQHKENLENITKLKKEEKSLDKKIGLLDDLVKLFEGKKFVEYAAKRQLEYITIDASVRLKDMSRGRYALELDGTDFIIRDDFNGGQRRSPKTLSGGETFLASLCLALALSAKVQLKSRSSLEFFFLDEGFGSLDSELLNTVVDSLIKLQTQNMKVGVISHVDELKSQIPSKLLVTPPTHGDAGSTVTLE